MTYAGGQMKDLAFEAKELIRFAGDAVNDRVQIL
jgi:hypothetical protein